MHQRCTTTAHKIAPTLHQETVQNQVVHHNINRTNTDIQMHNFMGYRETIQGHHHHRHHKGCHRILTRKSVAHRISIFNIIHYIIMILGLLTRTDAVDTELVSSKVNLMERYRIRPQHHKSIHGPIKPRYTPIGKTDHNPVQRSYHNQTHRAVQDQNN